MIVKLTEYEVSYLTKNDIFIGKKRFNLIQFEGGKGCNKSCVQDFYFFFFLSSFILSLSTLFPPYFHYLVFKDRNDIETKIFTSITNAPIMIQTAITAFFFFLLSSSFFFPSSRRSRSTSRFDEAAIHRSEQRLQPLSMLVDRALHRPTKRGYNATLVGVSALQTVKSIFTERARRGAGGRGESSLRDFIIRVECSSQKINVEIFVIKGEKDGGRVGYVLPMSTNKSSTLFIDK